MTDVEYKSGESTEHPGEPCDYMQCEVSGVTLYAEMPPVEGDECGTYDALRQQILEQARSEHIDTAILRFCYDKGVRP